MYTSAFSGATLMITGGTGNGEKLYETLMTKEERPRSEDMENYFRVAADNRDLNYDKYFDEDKVET